MKNYIILSMLLVTSFAAQSEQLSDLKNSVDRIAKIVKMPSLQEEENFAVIQEMSQKNKDLNDACQEFFTYKNYFNEYFGLPTSPTYKGCKKIKNLQNKIETSDEFKDILYDAIKENNANLVKDLITVGIDVNQADCWDNLPLNFAVRKNKFEVVKELLSAKKIEINKKDIRGETPLHKIAYYTKPEIINMVIQQKNIDVNAQDKKGKSLLHHMSSSWNIDRYSKIQNIFASRFDFDLNLLDVYNQTPLDIALQLGHLNTAKILREHGAKKASELE